MILIAHNIRSMWNVGSFFRTADAFGITHIHLTGYTPCPPRIEISKTALGAEGWIPWSKDANVLKVIEARKTEGYDVVSLEITQESTSLRNFSSQRPLCLIVGNEVLGVPDELLAASNSIVSIPMSGRKNSLNVSVALGVALYGLNRTK